MAILESVIKNLEEGDIVWLAWIAPSRSLKQGFSNCFAGLPINKI
jgi:cell division inhibitor SulA